MIWYNYPSKKCQIFSWSGRHSSIKYCLNFIILTDSIIRYTSFSLILFSSRFIPRTNQSLSLASSISFLFLRNRRLVPLFLRSFPYPFPPVSFIVFLPLITFLRRFNMLFQLNDHLSFFVMFSIVSCSRCSALSSWNVNGQIFGPSSN